MQVYIKKPLLLFFATATITILFSWTFLGTNFFERQLASLSGIITAWVTINPLEVEVSAPVEVEINKNFKVEATIFNKGEESIENSRAEIFLPPGLILIGKDSVQEIRVIPGKREKKISWQVRGETIGSYIITVSVSGELRGERISAEDSAAVEVKEFLLRGRARSLLQNLFDFFQEWLRF
jgi:hypothetical protein